MRGGPHSSRFGAGKGCGKVCVPGAGVHTCPGLCQEPCKCVPAREPACKRACAGRAARVCACVCLLRAPSLPVPPGAGGALGARGSRAELWDPGPGGPNSPVGLPKGTWAGLVGVRGEDAVPAGRVAAEMWLFAPQK